MEGVWGKQSILTNNQHLFKLKIFLPYRRLMWCQIIIHFSRLYQSIIVSSRNLYWPYNQYNDNSSCCSGKMIMTYRFYVKFQSCRRDVLGGWCDSGSIFLTDVANDSKADTSNGFVNGLSWVHLLLSSLNGTLPPDINNFKLVLKQLVRF